MLRPLRTGAACALLALALAGCRGEPPILAEVHGADQSAEISTFTAFVLYGAVPLLLLVLVGALAYLPGVVRSNRYRPARGWNAPPVWFSGPTDPAAAVQEADTGELVRGGASGSW